MKNIRCFVAGGSGGHIIPALTLAHQWIDQSSKNKVSFFSTTSSLDITIVNTAMHKQMQLITLPCTKISQSVWHMPLFALHLIFSFVQAFCYLAIQRPASIMSTGGLIAIPVCLAGFLLRIPIYLFELNVIPGKAIKFLASVATNIFVCFEEATHFLPKQKCIEAPYPLRAALIQEDISSLQIPHNKKVLLILGGSQGSSFLNNLIIEWVQTADSSLKHTLFIMHQAGGSPLEEYQQKYEQLGIEAQVFSFHPSPHTLYKQATVIVCRSGAGTLFEVAHFKKDCFTIPLLTKTTDHQMHNAHAMARQY